MDSVCLAGLVGEQHSFNVKLFPNCLLLYIDIALVYAARFEII